MQENVKSRLSESRIQHSSRVWESSRNIAFTFSCMSVLYQRFVGPHNT